MKMESRWKMRVIAITVGTVVALSIIYSAKLRRRRRKQKCPPSSCYLQADKTNPQQAFKRVLADNSYSPFKHLKLNESREGTFSRTVFGGSESLGEIKNENEILSSIFIKNKIKFEFAV
jgi:hypothetical protein